MKRKRTIFIELTSLLDVILIMIFVLLMQARTQTAQAVDQARQEQKAAREISRELEAARSREEAYENSLAALEEDVEGLKRQLDSRELVLENSLLLTISIGESDSIVLEKSPEGQVVIPYDWDNDNYAYNRLRSLLAGYLEETEDRPLFLVLQYDRNAIYKSQYDMILRAVQELKLSARERESMLSFIEMDVQE